MRKTAEVSINWRKTSISPSGIPSLPKVVMFEDSWGQQVVNFVYNIIFSFKNFIKLLVQLLSAGPAKLGKFLFFSIKDEKTTPPALQRGSLWDHLASLSEVLSQLDFYLTLSLRWLFTQCTVICTHFRCNGQFFSSCIGACTGRSSLFKRGCFEFQRGSHERAAEYKGVPKDTLQCSMWGQFSPDGKPGSKAWPP